MTQSNFVESAIELLRQFLETQKNLGMNEIAINESMLYNMKKLKKSTIAKEVAKEQLPESPKIPTITLPNASKEEQWIFLKNKVLSCETCLKNVKSGKNIVFGSGNLNADIFFCGEAPGAEEEEQGEVFVGKAGKLLTKIIEAMGLKRSDVYIGNIMNWRPETPNMIGNRPPTQEEMQFCLPYLLAQIDIVKPKVIVALGATAVNGLLGYDSKRRMRDIRGSFIDFQNSKMIITYHPSYLLRNQTNQSKRIVWEDMLTVMQSLNMPISSQQQNYFL